MGIIGQRGNPFISFADGVVPPALPIGGWVELGRTTLGSTSSTVTVSGLADKRYYKILSSLPQNAGSFNPLFRLGNSTVDTGNNYAFRFSPNGASDSTGTTKGFIQGGSAGSPTPDFGCHYIANLSSNEKLLQGHFVEQNTAGAGNAPNRVENTGKHAQTSNPNTEVQLWSGGGGTFAVGAEVVVLGWDPTDTHTTNFWEELFSGSGTSIDSGVAGIPAKKYLWIQIYLDGILSGTTLKMVLNGDLGSNYSLRRSIDGGSDSTFVNNSSGMLYHSGVGGEDELFVNMFMVNLSSVDKLAIQHSVYSTLAGAGTAPNREEIVNKWDDAAQITDIELTGTYGSASVMKVWGSN